MTLQIKNLSCVSANNCTAEIITQVTISDETFPFDFDDVHQFQACLSPQTVKDNLAALTDKVLDEDFMSIVLSKLNEVRDRVGEKTPSVMLDWSDSKTSILMKTPCLLDSFQAYQNHSTIPESQVKLLGPISRTATAMDISMWNISEIDTLAALMDSSNGVWDPSLARAIIMKYLTVNGNKLGSAELNSLGGPNLCTLDISVISNISAQSIE